MGTARVKLREVEKDNADVPTNRGMASSVPCHVSLRHSYFHEYRVQVSDTASITKSNDVHTGIYVVSHTLIGTSSNPARLPLDGVSNFNNRTEVRTWSSCGPRIPTDIEVPCLQRMTNHTRYVKMHVEGVRVLRRLVVRSVHVSTRRVNNGSTSCDTRILSHRQAE